MRKLLSCDLEWWVLSRGLNFLHASESLDSDDELLELLSKDIDEDRL